MREGVRPLMRPLASMRSKIEVAISFASKSAWTCEAKRTCHSRSSVRAFRQAIGALLSPKAAHASRLGVLQTGALRAGEASAAWDKSLRICGHQSVPVDHLGGKGLANATEKPGVENPDVKEEE
jgi:hypothetical protein